MPIAGGPTTWSGIYFQTRVAVYDIVLMICENLQNAADPIISVRVEAPTFVDDLVVERTSGRCEFQTVKESIQRSSRADSAWAKMWQGIRAQATDSQFRRDRDIIEIVFPESDALRGDLETLVGVAATAKTTDELCHDLNETREKIVADLLTLLGISAGELLSLLSRMRIRFVGDAQQLYAHINALLGALFSRDPAQRDQLLDTLVHIVMAGAKSRQ